MSEQAVHERTVAALDAAMGRHHAAAAIASGRAITNEDAIALMEALTRIPAG
jgi:hypothetical protein